MIFALWNKTWFPLEITADMFSSWCWGCDCMWFATHSQQIVGGFSVGVTPSREKNHHRTHYDACQHRQSWLSQICWRLGQEEFVVDESRWWWSDEAPTLTSCLYPFSPSPSFLFLCFILPTFSVLPSAYSHLMCLPWDTSSIHRVLQMYIKMMWELIYLAIKSHFLFLECLNVFFHYYIHDISK